MKRFFTVLLLLLVCLSLSGCTELLSAFEDKLTLPDRAVVLPAAIPDEFSDLDPTLLTDTEDLYFSVIDTDGPAAQYEAFCDAVASTDTAVIVTELTTGGYTRRMIEKAKSAGIPLVFCGAQPAGSVMESYDNSWYIGFDSSHAKELQAQLFVDAFHSRTLSDQDGDYKLSCLFAGTHTSPEEAAHWNSTVTRNMRLGGISCSDAAAPVTAADPDALSASLEQLLLTHKTALPTEAPADNEEVTTEEPLIIYAEAPPQTTAELFLCADTAASEAIIAFLPRLADEGSLAGRNYGIVCCGDSAVIRDAIEDGTVLGTVVKEKEQSTAAIRVVCRNLAKQQAVFKDTDYHFSDGKYLIFNYAIIQ